MFPGLPPFMAVPHIVLSVSVTRLHVLELSQILASCSSSCTNSTPSPRKGKEFSECLGLGCLEIYFLCHLLVITALRTRIPAPQNLSVQPAATQPLHPKLTLCWMVAKYNKVVGSILFRFCGANGIAALSLLSELAMSWQLQCWPLL